MVNGIWKIGLYVFAYDKLKSNKVCCKERDRQKLTTDHVL